MPKSKSKRRKKKSKRPSSSQSPTSKSEPLSSASGTVFEEDPLFTSVLFSPFVIGSVTASGFTEPALLEFTLILVPLIITHYLATFLEFSTQTGTSKRGLLLGNITKLIGVLFLEFALVGGFYYITRSSFTAALLAITIFILFILKRLPKTNLHFILIHCASLLISTSLLAVLGIFSQTGLVEWKTFVLGFATGSILAAATIAKNVLLLERRGWKRFYQLTKADIEKRENLPLIGAEVVEVGLSNESIHQVDECVNIADLTALSRLYQAILEKFAKRCV